jgi:branched-chain amino acid aminotransferase
MTCTVMIDGCIVGAEQAHVSVFDRGFLYGDSVFESFRTYGGKLFMLREHLTRLQCSAERVFIPLPLSLHELQSEIETAVQVQSSPECYVRLTLTRGVGRSLGLDPELAVEPLRVLLVTAFELPAPEIYEHGIVAITHRAERPGDAAGAASAKLGNYLLAVLAMREARAQGAREALIEDSDGHVLEGATSNLFAVFGGKLTTCPENAAILPGITRSRVIELAHSVGMALDFRAMAKLELEVADEVFVTSSLRELVPVVQINGKAVGSGVPGPTSRELLRLFRRAAQAS